MIGTPFDFGKGSLAGLVALAGAAFLGGCAQTGTDAASATSASAAASQAATVAAAASAATATAAAAPASAPTPPPLLPYNQAVLAAANALLGNAKLPPEGTPAQSKYTVLIDPLIDGVTGVQSNTTRSMGNQLETLIRQQYPQFDVQPFTGPNVERSPLVLIGTFTGVNAQRQTSGARESYRICFALADLKSGKLVSKGLAFAKPEGVDPTPTTFFRDMPAWAEDPATLGYIRTCQGTKAGDPINPMYLERILAAAFVSEAIDAYNAGRYQTAIDRYTAAQLTSAGDQFRVYNGLYLSYLKLGQRDKAQAAFAKIVDFGLERKRLALKFLFRPGSTAFGQDGKTSAPYPVWLKTIADRAATSSTCLEMTGHTSPTGAEPLNERLSTTRAEYVKSLLDTAAPALAKRTIANGVGSKQTMIGTGRDDASDALDRRVEFKVMGCPS